MEQAAAKTKAGQASPAGTFSMKLGKTTYVVGVHFSQTAKDTLEDKMKRLMKDDTSIAAIIAEMLLSSNSFDFDFINWLLVNFNSRYTHDQ